jgi:tetratricopeptide (TPR) repeat protein
MSLFKVGQKIEGKYLVKQVLQGGMGLVYVCYDEIEGVPVAIKSFQPRFFEDKNIREYFIQEAKLWIELGWHTNIVCALYAEKFNDIPHIIMEYIPGNNLRQQYLTFQRASLVDIFRIAVQVCNGMMHATNTMAHKGITLIHRDLKPENILMTSGGIVKITDFGIAKVIPLKLIRLSAGENAQALPDRNIRKTTGIAGTYPYMSPEQFIGIDLDSRSDIYSFGCVLYELLTGRPPFMAIDHEGWQAAHMYKMPTCPSKIGSIASSSWDDLVLCCLQKDPSQRWNDFEELFQSVKTIAEGTGLYIRLPKSIAREELSTAVEMGTSLNALGYHEQAVSTFDKALKMMPGVSILWYNRGEALFYLKRYREAIESYDHAIHLNPDYSLAYISKGAMLSLEGKYGEAKACFEKALLNDPLSSVALCNMAGIFFSTGRIEEALRTIEQAIMLNPSRLDFHKFKLYMLANSERKEEFKVCFERFLQDYPTAVLEWDRENIANFGESAATLTNLGWSLEQIDQLEQALQCYDRAINCEPDDAQAWYNRGCVLSRMENFEDALSSVERAIALNPQYMKARINKAAMLERCGHIETALTTIDSLIKATPDSPIAWTNRGTYLSKLNRHDEAMESFDHAINLDPSFSEALFRKGDILAKDGLYAEAMDCILRGFEKCTDENLKELAQRLLTNCMIKLKDRIDNENIPLWKTKAIDEAWASKADLLINLGRHKDALKCAEKCLKENKSNASGWYFKGACIAALGDRKAAIPCYDKAIQLKPDIPQAWNNKGYCLRVLGNIEEALPCFEKAVELQPSLLIAWLNLQEALMLLERFDKAVEKLDWALRLMPDEARLWLSKGMGLANLGRKKEAIVTLQVAKRLGDPNADQIIQTVQKLR